MIYLKKIRYLQNTFKVKNNFLVILGILFTLIICNSYAEEAKSSPNNGFEIINPENLSTLGNNPSQPHPDLNKTPVPNDSSPKDAPSIPAPIKLAPTLAPPNKSTAAPHPQPLPKPKPIENPVPVKLPVVPAPNVNPSASAPLPANSNVSTVESTPPKPVVATTPPADTNEPKPSVTAQPTPPQTNSATEANKDKPVSDPVNEKTAPENKKTDAVKNILKKGEYEFTEWNGSLMFSQKNIDNLKKLLDRMASNTGNSGASNKKHKQDINSIFASAEKVDVAPTFYLPSILYRDKNEWVVWLNDVKFTADNSAQWKSLIPFFELVSVEKFYVVFKWRTHFIDHLSPTWRTKLVQDENGDYYSPEKDIFVNAEMNDIMFKLKPNQSFAAFTMSIEEGRVAPTNVGPLPVEDDKSKQADDKTMFDIMPK